MSAHPRAKPSSTMAVEKSTSTVPAGRNGRITAAARPAASDPATTPPMCERRTPGDGAPDRVAAAGRRPAPQPDDGPSLLGVRAPPAPRACARRRGEDIARPEAPAIASKRHRRSTGPCSNERRCLDSRAARSVDIGETKEMTRQPGVAKGALLPRPCPPRTARAPPTRRVRSRWCSRSTAMAARIFRFASPSSGPYRSVIVIVPRFSGRLSSGAQNGDGRDRQPLSPDPRAP